MLRVQLDQREQVFGETGRQNVNNQFVDVNFFSFSVALQRKILFLHPCRRRRRRRRSRRRRRRSRSLSTISDHHLAIIVFKYNEMKYSKVEAFRCFVSLKNLSGKKVLSFFLKQ